MNLPFLNLPIWIFRTQTKQKIMGQTISHSDLEEETKPTKMKNCEAATDECIRQSKKSLPPGDTRPNQHPQQSQLQSQHPPPLPSYDGQPLPYYPYRLQYINSYPFLLRKAPKQTK
jgi:hypothetical protein